jgi:hypothetical protein
MEFQETGCEGVDWIQLAPNDSNDKALVNMVMELEVPLKAGIFLTSSETLFHEGSYFFIYLWFT